MAKIIDNYLDRAVGATIKANNDAERAAHISSGRLSASMLGQPLQWQILKMMGVPSKEHEEYTLRKFLRGNHVEEWIISVLPNLHATQEPVSYRNVGGVIDAVVDTVGWDFPCGVAPAEVKSVSNMKFKRIVGNTRTGGNGPDRGHCLQGTLYALAKGAEAWPLIYVATDDYRIHTFIIKTADWAAEVERVIDRFDAQLATGLVPVFEPEEKWQANAMYNNYPEWSLLDEEGIAAKLAEFKANKK